MIIVSKIYTAAMARARMEEKDRKDFYLYVDEFQNFINDSFAQILSQARKYKLGLIVAHQYVKQMTEIVHDAIFGNVGTMIAFRIGADDAESFEKEFKPTFLPEDFTNIGRFQMYLKLMIDGVTSSAFSASSMGPYPKPDNDFVKEIIESSRALYSHPRKEVEDHILKWTIGNKGEANTSAEVKKEVREVKEVRRDPMPTSTPMRDNFNSRPRQDMRQEMRRSEPRSEPRREREISMPVHNPFKSAFKDIEPEVKKVVEEKKVGVDEQTLKDILGISE